MIDRDFEKLEQALFPARFTFDECLEAWASALVLPVEARGMDIEYMPETHLELRQNLEAWLRD